MNDREFYEELNKKIKDLTKEQLIVFLNNVIRKIPNSKYKEIISMLDNDNSKSSKDIEKQIKEYEEKFELINDFDLYFTATGYEDYSKHHGDWVWQYSDNDNIGKIIADAYNYAVDLVFDKEYKYAKELFDMILDTNYQVLDEYVDDSFELNLLELQNEDLINIDAEKLCAYALYTTYQTTKGDVQEIYEYFKTRTFKKININIAFNVGIEKLEDTDKFFDNWIKLLVNSDDRIAYRLLKESLEYTNFNNYQEYIDLFLKKYPQIYLDIFDYLVKSNQINELVKIGTKVLPKLDKKLKIRSDIILCLAKYDKENKEKYIIEAFESRSDIPNLVRIINNGYYSKYQDLIEETIDLNIKEKNIDKNTYNYLKLFQGKYDDFFEECLNNKEGYRYNFFLETAVNLWILVLDNRNQTNLYLEILDEVFNRLGFKDNLLFLDDDFDSIFKKWKENNLIKDNIKYIEWLKKVVSDYTDKILNNQERGLYSNAAKLVVALGEVLEGNNLMPKKVFINNYLTTYSKYSLFRKEINNYWSKE